MEAGYQIEVSKPEVKNNIEIVDSLELEEAHDFLKSQQMSKATLEVIADLSE